VGKYTHNVSEGAAFSDIFVPTIETTRLTFLLDDLASRQKPVMLVGGAGTAKTTIIQDKLSQLPEEVMSFNIAFNSFTGSGALQPILEQPLEKKTGTMFAPPGTKKVSRAAHVRAAHVRAAHAHAHAHAARSTHTHITVPPPLSKRI